MIHKRSTRNLIDRYEALCGRAKACISNPEQQHIQALIERIEQEMVRRYGTERGLTERYVLWCSDLEEQGITTEPCCGSCHSEWDEEYSEPQYGRLKDGRYFETCCAKKHDMQERGLADA